MPFTESDVLEFVEENDIRFVRLAFCNLFGVQKNIAIMADKLADAFSRGVSVDMASVEGFYGEEDAELLLHPDPSTLSTLPWRPIHGGVARLFCHIRLPDGRAWPGDGRTLLRGTVDRLAENGLDCRVGSECEFYLLRLDDRGEPTTIPQDTAGYCDIAPHDKGENVRREICLALGDMGIPPESSHHERGPGQNEIVLRHQDALAAADALVSLHAVTEVIAARNGLWASFDPKPFPDRHGSSVHLHLSLHRDGHNLFRADGQHNPEAERFMAGILHHLADLTLFLNALPGSSRRFGDDVPREIAWTHQSRNQLVRVPAPVKGRTHMELRSPDPSLNPYYAFALLLEAGLWGIRQSLELRSHTPVRKHLPETLEAAVELARRSELVARVIPADALAAYCAQKKHEADRWNQDRDRA